MSSITDSFTQNIFEVSILLTIIYIITIVFGIITYVLNGIGLTKIGANRKLKHPWFAWIPFLATFQLGYIADEFNKRFENKQTNNKVKLLVFSIIVTTVLIIVVVMAIITAVLPQADAFRNFYSPAYAAFEGISIATIIICIIMVVISIIFSVFYYIALYKVFKWCSEKPVVFLVLSIVISITQSFFIFSLKDKMNERFLPIVPTKIQE